VMKPVITKVIEKQIRDNFMKADAFAYSIYQDVQRSAKVAMDDPDQAQNIYSQYVSAFQKKMTEKKEQAKQKSADTKVNLAVTQQDSIFKNISLPGGISTKATEFKELAAKGNKWESPVFGIGSARESSSIPKLAAVTRKPHNAASGVVRGGNHPGREGTSSMGELTQGTDQSSNNYGNGHQTGNYGGQQSSDYNADAYQSKTGTGAYAAKPTYQGQGETAQYGGTQGNGFGNQVDQAFNKSSTPAMTNGNPGSAGSGGGTYYDQVSAAR